MLKRKSSSSAKKATGGIEGRFQDVSSLKTYRTFVFYGRSGTGKTTLSCSAPGSKLLIDVRDRGTDSVSDIKGLKVCEAQSTEDMEEIYWWLRDNPDKFKNIIVDTVTQWQTLKVSEFGDKRKKKNAGDWGSLSRRDWGDIAAYMKEWLMNYRDLADLGMNVIFIAQDRAFNFGEEEDDEVEGQLAPEVGPALSPSVAKSLNAMCSMIGNTFIRSRVVKKRKDGKTVKRRVEDYCLRVGPNPLYVTKVRKPIKITAPEFLVDPVFEDIIDLIKGE